MGEERHTDVVVDRRPASVQDEPFLREMLAAAADWRPGTTVRPGFAVVRDPAIAHYLAGWPQEGDFGVIAHDDGAPIGATWCRFFSAEPRGYGFVASNVPELTIGVIARRRGEGIGRMLLTEVIREAHRRGIERVSLSVEADNPAIHLYADVGFVEVSRASDAPTMVVECASR